MQDRYDVIIVGAGIGGAGIAAALGSRVSVLILEQEDQPGYHTTGRSAAFYAETYGGPSVQPLTTASGPFLTVPPGDFGTEAFIQPRGALYIFSDEERAASERMAVGMAAIAGIEILSGDAVRARVPDIRWPRLAGAVYDPTCGDLSVAALHQAYLGYARRHGATLACGHRFCRAQQTADGWLVTTDRGSVRAGMIVNAAGAWADEVARCAGLEPIGLTPLRRTVVVIPEPPGARIQRDSPVVLMLDESCYFRPEGEGYLISPADETPSAACDAQPEEIDVAIALDRFKTCTGLDSRSLTARWAGLRNFAADRAPVIGEDPTAPGFYWSAGQGGWGIQTSPAWSAMLAEIMTGQQALGVDLSALDPAAYGAERFR